MAMMAGSGSGSGFFKGGVKGIKLGWFTKTYNSEKGWLDVFRIFIVSLSVI